VRGARASEVRAGRLQMLCGVCAKGRGLPSAQENKKYIQKIVSGHCFARLFVLFSFFTAQPSRRVFYMAARSCIRRGKNALDGLLRRRMGHCLKMVECGGNSPNQQHRPKKRNKNACHNASGTTEPLGPQRSTRDKRLAQMLKAI
jgi:hypothetical protein